LPVDDPLEQAEEGVGHVLEPLDHVLQVPEVARVDPRREVLERLVPPAGVVPGEQALDPASSVDEPRQLLGTYRNVRGVVQRDLPADDDPQADV
jgi:hypothetical protein